MLRLGHLLAFAPPDATLIAAVVAALAAVPATVVSAIGAAQSRRRADREQWWTRFIWAIDRATSGSAE